MSIAAPVCPDPNLRQAKIGGNAIIGNVMLHRKPLKFARVRLYSASGEAAWNGRADKKGGFVIDKIPSGDYRLEIDGWGITSVQLDPNLDRGFGGQVPAWSLLLRDNGCVGASMFMN